MTNFTFAKVLRNLIFLSFLGTGYLAHSQIQISGMVKDSLTTEGVGSATVVFSPVGAANILGYGISDREGNFQVKLTTSEDSLQIKVSSLGYETFTKALPAKTQELVVQLNEKAESLEEIFLRRPPIRQHGDTLVFDPAAFKSNKDRSIQDVLSKMPGIDIDPSGEIQYQGKPINKFYVEGLDLTEGRYGMITNNLSPDKVQSVEVLENHQPLKVLDSIEPSDQAAINLKLKNNVTLSGNMEVGAGASPGLWYAKLNPMFFTKKFQALVTYQTNNTGANVTSDFTRFSIGSFRFGYGSGNRKNWVSLPSPSSPPFTQNRWLDNQAHAVSANVMVKDKNDYEFKINTSYINNLVKREGGNKTTYLLPEGDLTIDNKTQNQSRDESLEVSLTVERNVDKSFLKETLTFAKQWDRASAFLTENDEASHQQLKNPFSNFKNDFEYVFPWGKELLTFDSNIGYNESPQDLVIQPGVFGDILNSGLAFDEVEQQVSHKRFYANHSLDFTKSFGAFSVSFRPGVDFSIENMDSHLLLDGLRNTDSAFQNDMKWQQLSTYLQVRSNYQTDNLRISLSLPMNLNNYQIEDRLSQTTQKETPFTVNPFFWTEYQFWDYWKASGNLGFNRNFGPLNQMYNGYLLGNYRNLSRNNIPLMESASSNFGTGLEYRNPITTWFARIRYSHSEGKQYQIFNTKTQANGATVVEALDQINKTGSNSVNASASRLISPLKTTFKLGTSYTHSNSDMLFNDELMKNTSDRWSHSVGLSGDFTSWITAEYDGSLSLSTTKNQLQNSRKVQTQNHKLGLYFYFLKNHTLNFSGEYLRSKLENDHWSDFFGDMMYRFTLSDKRKIDFELAVVNVFNKDIYRNLSVGDYTFSESYYYLRPRQFLVKIRFPL